MWDALADAVASALRLTQAMVSRRTAKVTVGSQLKYSNMVKGRQHDQTFDETLEFVLAAGAHCQKHTIPLQTCDMLFGSAES